MPFPDFQKSEKRGIPMIPSREEALRLLAEAEAKNPGPWGNHSRIAAHCAEQIALRCDSLDAEKAYILGLLHDIGRRFGIRHLGHVSDGYRYMLSQGYDEVARVCLTHSFNTGRIGDYVGKFDTAEDELSLIANALTSVTFDEYDLLIQLADALAGTSCILNVEERMQDVKERYGYYPEEKWNKNLALLEHFERQMKTDVYTVVGKEGFRPV
jgi:hypothetical protein